MCHSELVAIAIATGMYYTVRFVRTEINFVLRKNGGHRPVV